MLLSLQIKDKFAILSEALKNHPVKVYAGADALDQIVQMESVDIVLAAMVGYSGLMPVINAIKGWQDNCPGQQRDTGSGRRNDNRIST
jgi:1-deoxy-D-xylulose 5-phosphate reductoisomerase